MVGHEFRKSYHRINNKLVHSRTPEFIDFVRCCLQKNPIRRPTAEELLKHPFVRERTNSVDIVQGLIKRVREAKRVRRMIQEEEDDEEDNFVPEFGKEDEAQSRAASKQASKMASRIASMEELAKARIEGKPLPSLPPLPATPPQPAPAINPPGLPGRPTAAVKADEKRLYINTAAAAQKHPPAFPIIPLPKNPFDESKPFRKPVFRAARLCRLPLKVNCADALGNTILFGTADGLYAYDIESNEGKVVPISGRRYEQINVVADWGFIVSRSGKYSGCFCFHGLAQGEI